MGCGERRVIVWRSVSTLELKRIVQNNSVTFPYQTDYTYTQTNPATCDNITSSSSFSAKLTANILCEIEGFGVISTTLVKWSSGFVPVMEK